MQCARCGRDNRADAAFCDGCGSALQRAVVAVTTREEPPRTPPERFVGRERELAALEAGLTRALNGVGGTAALAGEPGIGKSHTAQVLAQRAAALGMQVLWGRCNEEPGAPPYWSWLQLVRGWLETHDEATAKRVLGHDDSALAEILPHLAERAPAGALVLPAIDPAQARFRLFDAMAGFWKRAAAEQPLLLVLDNLHWADASSLRLLEFIAPDLVTRRILLVITYRDIELSRQHPLSGTLGELARHQGFERLRLTGLARDETVRMMMLAGGGTVPPALADAIHRQTEGNPLFVAEMTRLLIQEQVLGEGLRGSGALMALGGPRRIPEGVREVIGRRLNRLSPMANHVLACASVIGRTFDVGLLARIVDDLEEDACTDALEEALQSRVIEAVEGPGRYHFGHALFRETLYDEIPPPRRSRLHLKVGRAIEDLHGEDSAPHLPALAYHYWAALPGGDGARASYYAQQAARSSDALLAHEEAARYYRLALQAMDVGRGGDALVRCRVLNSLGEAHTRAGEYLQAREVFDEAARTSMQSDHAIELARAALGFEVASWCPGLPGFAAARLLRDALNALGAEDRVMKAQLLSALARALIFSGEETQAMKVHEEAVTAARRAGDPGTLATTLLAALSARWQPDRITERIASADEAIQIARQQGDRFLLFSALAWRMFDAFELGDMTTWREQLEAYSRGAEELRQPFFLYVASSSRTLHALFEGRFDDAERHAKRTFEIGDRMPGLDAAGVYGVQMFTLRREQGRLQEVAPLVRHFVQQNAQTNVWRPGLSLIYVELGQLDDARSEFEVLANERFQSFPRDGVWLASLAYLAQVCAAIGDAARAEELYKLLEGWRGRNLLVGTSIACFGAADAFLGMLSATMRKWSDAEAHFRLALEMNELQNARPALAQARHGYAQMLHARDAPGDREAALSQLDAAAMETAALQMRALSARVDALRAEIANVSVIHYPAGLSSREAQVLRLVAVGKGNRQIARELFVSPNTVANHVRSILSKTRSANRTEAAAFAIHHDLLKEADHRPQ